MQRALSDFPCTSVPHRECVWQSGVGLVTVVYGAFEQHVDWVNVRMSLTSGSEEWRSKLVVYSKRVEYRRATFSLRQGLPQLGPERMWIQGVGISLRWPESSKAFDAFFCRISAEHFNIEIFSRFFHMNGT